MAAFNAFVDANKHDTECLKHATIITKVAIPLLLYVSAQHWADFETQYVLDKYFLPLFSLHVDCGSSRVLR